MVSDSTNPVGVTRRQHAGWLILTVVLLIGGLTCHVRHREPTNPNISNTKATAEASADAALESIDDSRDAGSRSDSSDSPSGPADSDGLTRSVSKQKEAISELETSSSPEIIDAEDDTDDAKDGPVFGKVHAYIYERKVEMGAGESKYKETLRDVLCFARSKDESALAFGVRVADHREGFNSAHTCSITGVAHESGTTPGGAERWVYTKTIEKVYGPGAQEPPDKPCKFIIRLGEDEITAENVDGRCNALGICGMRGYLGTERFDRADKSADEHRCLMPFDIRFEGDAGRP